MNHRRRRADMFENLPLIIERVEVESRLAEETKASLRQDIYVLGGLYEQDGQTELAKRCYRETFSGNYSAESICAVGRMYMDGDYFEGDTPKACHYFEIAYEMGERNIRSGDYLMMGTYHQFDVKEGKQYGLFRDMPLAVKWYLKFAEKQPNGYSHVGCAYMEKEIRDYKKAFQCFLISLHICPP